MKKRLIVFLVTAAVMTSIVYAAQTKNLALGIIPTTTFNDVGNKAAVLTDGKTAPDFDGCSNFDFGLYLDVRDSSFTDSFGKNTDGYIEFDLGAVCRLTGYRVYNYKWGAQYCMNKAWKLVVSIDGESFVEVHSVKDVTTWSEYNHYDITPVSARYVRLCVTELHIGGSIKPLEKVRLYEVMLFGSGTPVLPSAADDEMIPADGEMLRRFAVSNALKNATMKWTPSEDIVTKHERGSTGDTWRELNYLKGITYYGALYNRYVRTTSEMVASVIKDGVYYGGTDTDTAYGLDCTGFVYDSTSKIVPTSDFYLNRYLVDKWFTPLGNIKVLESDNRETEKIKARYTKQELFEAYAALRPGDIVVRNPLHVRIVTGETFFFRNGKGELDGTGYVECSETYPYYDVLLSEGVHAIYQTNHTENREADPVIYVKRHIIKKGSSTETFGSLEEIYKKYPGSKIITGHSMRVNYKYTFDDLYDKSYIPVTLNAYHDNMTTAVKTSLFSKLDPDDVEKNGIIGVVTSNYIIHSVKAVITDRIGRTVYTEDDCDYGFTYRLSSLTGTNSFIKNELPGGKYTCTVYAATGPVLSEDGTQTTVPVFSCVFYKNKKFITECENLLPLRRTGGF